MPPLSKLTRISPILRHLRPPLARSEFQQFSKCTHQRRQLVIPPPGPKSPLDPISLHRSDAERRAYYQRRTYYSAAGFLAGMVCIWVIATSIDLPPQKPTKADSKPHFTPPPTAPAAGGTTVVSREEEDVVQTGTGSVPTFPRVFEFDEGAGDKEVGGIIENACTEYQLVGLGIRTVSFLRIQVYVMGFYVASDDIAALQAALIRKIDPVASSLVAGEKNDLREMLLDSEKGDEIWQRVLKAGVRTIVRVVPTRDTDFAHLRDGWVRAIMARMGKEEGLGESVGAFKGAFGKGSVRKGREMLLVRDEKGGLAVWYDDGKSGRRKLGEVQDERISRAVWLNYLAGKTVASEAARRSVVEGLMEFVERPVGSVATQVHV